MNEQDIWFVLYPGKDSKPFLIRGGAKEYDPLYFIITVYAMHHAKPLE